MSTAILALSSPFGHVAALGFTACIGLVWCAVFVLLLWLVRHWYSLDERRMLLAYVSDLETRNQALQVLAMTAQQAARDVYRQVTCGKPI